MLIRCVVVSFLLTKLSNAILDNQDPSPPPDEDTDDPQEEEEETRKPSELSEDEDNSSVELDTTVLSTTLVCQRTKLKFPTSELFQLLYYDDGIIPSTTIHTSPQEHVFCRICREGLHDDAEELPAAATEEGAYERAESMGVQSSEDEVVEPTNATDDDDPGPLLPHPVYHPHTEENPMLAPCQCSGSMAFVHYMCIEQWRCRSRHPTANNGLNCETCGGAYALPAPTQVLDHHDASEWQDAMPPHVMNALRQPHIWWQLGAAIVRRRWLRPMAPIVMSPIVALYCRSRRLLKKRGVARRRWACSLCRRRARWKCVRCLRSYYCSRQCQNVSWHIIHKHVCYKPVRMYGSIIFYSILALFSMNGIVRDPLYYDMGMLVVPSSFIMVAILAGGVATVLKKSVGIDTRGRRLEGLVVILTIFITMVSIGLFRGFFGEESSCYGYLGRYEVTQEDLSSTYFLKLSHDYVLTPFAALCRYIDTKALMIPRWTRLCSNDTTCFAHLGSADAGFYLSNETCAGDFLFVGFLYLAAFVTYVSLGIHKHFERHQRRRRHMHAD